MNEATKPLKKVMRGMVDNLEKNKKNVNEKEPSDTKEMIEGLADRLQKIEERMDLLIELISPNNEVSTAGKTGSRKAETKSNSSDDESSSDKEPCKKKTTLDAKTRLMESTGDDNNEESDDEKETYPYSHGLHVGDPFVGGCGLCRMG